MCTDINGVIHRGEQFPELQCRVPLPFTFFSSTPLGGMSWLGMDGMGWFSRKVTVELKGYLGVSEEGEESHNQRPETALRVCGSPRKLSIDRHKVSQEGGFHKK